MTAVRLVALVLGASAPAELARFWARALRWSVGEPGGTDVALAPDDATSFGLSFRPVAIEKVGQNRIHFDLTSTSLDDQRHTVAELLSAGASHADVGQTPEDTHVVLADPEGNELCIIEPDNDFLSSCPRLGAVNCDGTRELGYFFSQALGWPLVWDQDEETAIQSPDGTGPKITWSGPPLMPKPPTERLHFHVAPAVRGSSVPASAVDRLLELGASRLDAGDGCPGAVPLADVDGNAFCLVPSS